MNIASGSPNEIKAQPQNSSCVILCACR